MIIIGAGEIEFASFGSGEIGEYSDVDFVGIFDNLRSRAIFSFGMSPFDRFLEQLLPCICILADFYLLVVNMFSSSDTNH